MERSLILILNAREDNRMPMQDTVFLTLDTMDTKELDVYISKNFESSHDVREKYADKINHFLKQHCSLVERVEKQIGRKFNGSIVIVELDNDLIFERKKVLYKKHMTLFKEITKNRKFMIALESRDYLNACKAKTDNRPYRRLFSEFFSKELRFHCCSEDKFKRISGQWRNAIKESKYYYDYVRIILKEYEERYKGLGLDSLDVIYSKYLNNIENKKQSRKMTEIKMELEALAATTPKDSLSKDLLSHLSDYEEPKRYRTYADEDGYPGDLEPGGQDSLLDNETSGVERGKTKTLSNGHSILFDSES